MIWRCPPPEDMNIPPDHAKVSLEDCASRFVKGDPAVLIKFLECAMLIKFLEWLERTKHISLARPGYAGELIQCGDTPAELAAEFLADAK